MASNVNKRVHKGFLYTRILCVGMTDSKISLDMNDEEWAQTSNSYIRQGGRFIRNPDQDTLQ